MGSVRYWVGVLLVVSLPPGIIWWFVVHPFIGFWRRLGARAAAWAVGVLMVGLVVALVPLRRVLVGSDLGTSWPLVALAALLMAAGAGLSLWRRRYLTQRMLSGANELEGDASTLLTQGPYAVIRHPRYVEVLVFSFAYASFANYVGAWAVAALAIPLLHLVVILEERELSQRFGTAWEEYRARVPRYFPRVARNSTSISSQSGR
jgi:protein-S-isoprenylcysteine O-methyltransferase Ste14